MDLIMDGLLTAATLFAGAYCWVLAGRVRALKSLDGGLGGAIVTLTRQIELARATLDEARGASRETRQDLSQLTARADAAAAQLRLLLAAIEKVPAPPPAVALPQAATAPQAAAMPAPVAEPAPAALAQVDDLAARRREIAAPRLVSLAEPEDEEPEAPPPLRADDGTASLPKPRRTLPLDGLLRRRAAPAADTPRVAASESELIAALSAIAAGGER